MCPARLHRPRAPQLTNPASHMIRKSRGCTMTLTSRSLRDRPSRNRTRTLWAFSLRYMRSSKRRTTRNYKTSRARRAPGRVRSGRAPRHPRCGNGAGTARDLPRHVPRPPAQCIGICSRGWRIEDARGQASPTIPRIQVWPVDQEPIRRRARSRAPIQRGCRKGHRR